MPSHYAHYRFGSAAIAFMDPHTRQTMQRFRQLYDVGLHGPDIFFYHSIFFHGKAFNLAKETHGEAGMDFFARVCQQLRQEPNEAAMAYLYGVLAHYCLDSALHPFVKAQTEEGKIGHVELETEFDRFLLLRDGKRQPNTFDGSHHVKLTRGECSTAAGFYPTATAAMVNTGVRGMARWMKVLAMPNGNLRRIVEVCAGDSLRPHFMGRSPNKNCAHLNEPMLELYHQALERFPAMAAELQAHLADNAPLGEAFEATFNG